MAKITKIIAREILDSRGFPTVQADVCLDNGVVGTTAVPSGASTGKFEALELRDNDKSRYAGKGVLNAVAHVNTTLAFLLQGQNPENTAQIDKIMLEADGTPDKSKLGANAILAVSLAAAKAAAMASGQQLYQKVGGKKAAILPVPMMNILNGGAHATNNIDIQEFMIMPVGAPSYAVGLCWCAEVYHTLAAVLKAEGLATAVGDEGGFAPSLENDEAALHYIAKAIKKAGYKLGSDFVFAIDAAASEWALKEGGYRQPKSGRAFTSEELVEYWADIAKRWPLASLEDGLGEEDWAGWKHLTKQLGSKMQLVGDDLFVTNVQRLQRGITEGCANAILIKPNQIGSLSETLAAIEMARRAGFSAVMSHRSGETEDTTIADLAVGAGTGQIKTGAPARSERVAKYNRLLVIEEQLGADAIWLGVKCFGAHSSL